MEIQLVHLMAEAGAAIDAAMEHTETGGPEWERLLGVRSAIERMVTYEVTTTWPAADEPEGLSDDDHVQVARAMNDATGLTACHGGDAENLVRSMKQRGLKVVHWPTPGSGEGGPF